MHPSCDCYLGLLRVGIAERRNVREQPPVAPWDRSLVCGDRTWRRCESGVIDRPPRLARVVDGGEPVAIRWRCHEMFVEIEHSGDILAVSEHADALETAPAFLRVARSESGPAERSRIEPSEARYHVEWYLVPRLAVHGDGVGICAWRIEKSVHRELLAVR